MKEIVASRDVDAHPERVWGIVTDLERSPEVLSGVDEVEILEGGDGFGVGTRWRETRTMFGRQAEEVMAVTAVEEGASYTVRAESGGTVYTSVIEVQALDGGTRLTMRFVAETTGLVGRVMAATVGRLFAGATRKMLRRDLDDIAAEAEPRS